MKISRMASHHLLMLVVISTMQFSQIASADDSLAAFLADLDSEVVTGDEAEQIRDRFLEGIRERRASANAASSAAWSSIDSVSAWVAFAAPRLQALRDSLGMFPDPPRELHIEVTRTTEGDGFRVRNLAFESRNGLWVTANLYGPNVPRESIPGILICHSHHTPKEHGELQDMGMTWARAGCYVLVMDQLGHGERRQHPFVDGDSYPRPFRVSRQDYYFRYDNGVQLHLAGESLIGWMAWDLMRGVDLLLEQPDVDPERIILLGSVAGGGDPAAVAAAIDQRITAAVPFNFGGPQPETRYPLPDDAEQSFNYAGGGSWESTRNLRRSISGRFLPWVIVGGIAPRRLVYAHEFNWDQPRDPVWKRLQSIYALYDASESLASAHGRGSVSGQSPESTHCTHIGAVHRTEIHRAFEEWFGIRVTPDDEYSNRLPSEQLRCVTPEFENEFKPHSLSTILNELVAERIDGARKRRAKLSAQEYRSSVQDDWHTILGSTEPADDASAEVVRSVRNASVTAEHILLSTGDDRVVPVLLLSPLAAEQHAAPAVICLAQAGKAGFLRTQAAEISLLLEAGCVVCLPDVTGTGEIQIGEGRSRRSWSTSVSSSLLMHGETMLSVQLRDVRSVCAWLRRRNDVDERRIGLWGDSLVAPNDPGTDFNVPRGADDPLPRQPEPLGGVLALLTALYEESVSTVFVHRGLSDFRSALAGHLVLLPHDIVVPGALTTGDLSDVVAAIAPRPVRIESPVDARNLAVSSGRVMELYQPAVESYRALQADAAFSANGQSTSPAEFLIEQLGD